MSDQDPFEILAELSRSRREAGFGTGPDPDDVLARLPARRAQTPSPRRHRRRWWRLAAAGLIAITAAAGGTAAWAVLQRERPTSPTTIQCLQHPDLDGSQAVIAADGTDPVGQCAAVWEQNSSTWGPQPPLSGCVSPPGNTVIVPGDESTCAAMGLALLDPTVTDDDRTVIELRETLSIELGAHRCVPPDEAQQIANRMLTERNLDGWSVVIEGDFTSQMPCGMSNLDTERRTIFINPFTDFHS